MDKFKLTISEYGKEVRSYSDDKKDRFLDIAAELIVKHLKYNAYQATDEVKNITFHIATYS